MPQTIYRDFMQGSQTQPTSQEITYARFGFD